MSNSLSAVHPELVAEWSDRNLPLTPDSITFGSNKKVWWKGACGHEWETSVKARSNGEKCPICSGARVVTGINDLSTLKPELASEWSEKNKIKPTEVSIGSHKKVIWKCKLGHKWIATVKSRTINKTGCPYCSHNKVLVGFNDLATLFPEVADEWSDRNENSPTEVMAFANSKAWWKCRTCGYEWNTLISTRSGGSKCPCCSGYTFIKGKNDLKSTHPQIAKEWSEKNYPLQPDEVNAKSRKNVWWHCRKCGNEWKSVINARVKGTVCPVCAEREVLAGYNDLATTDKQVYGTSRINAYKIIEETLNLKDVRIFDYIEDDEGKKKAVLNKKETAIAQSKQEMIKQEFQDWIWSDPERRERLCKSYNEKFNSVRPREYDGSHIIFNGMNPELSSIGNNINQLAAKANTLGFIDAPMLKNEAAKWNKFQSEIERTYLRPNQSEMKWQ